MKIDHARRNLQQIKMEDVARTKLGAPIHALVTTAGTGTI